MKNTLSIFGIVALIATLVWFPQAGQAAEDGATEIAVLDRQEPVSFEREILPIFRRNCLACHNATDAESDLVLEDTATILQGGASGEAIIPGDGSNSLLLQVAAYQAEPLMPPEDNDVGAEQLTPQELGLLKLWIDQGAQAGDEDVEEIDWQPLPPGVNPIYSVAVTDDGQFAAAGRANQIFVYHLPSKQLVGRLSDPELQQAGVADRPGVAHRDLVQSLRFSPDGTWLASGGYKTVKLWRRPNAKRLSLAGIAGQPTAIALSRDGRSIALGMQNGDVQLLSGTRLVTLAGHRDTVTTLIFTGDEPSQLISTSLDATLRIWDAVEGAAIATIEVEAAAHSMVLLADGKIAVGQETGKIDVYQRPGGEGSAENATDALRTLSGHEGPVTGLAVSEQQPHQLVSAGQDATVRVWDVETAEQLRSWQHHGPVQAVAVAPDGSRIAARGEDEVAVLWDGSGKEIAKLQGDHREQLRLQHSEQLVAVAKRGIENAKADLKETTDRKKAEEENVKKATEAEKKTAEQLAEKEKQVDQQAQKRVEVAERVARVTATVAAATEQKQAADKRLAQAGDLMADVQTALAAAQQAMAAAAEKMKTAEAEQQQAEQARQQAEEKVVGVKEELAKVEAELKKVDEAKQKAIAERETAEKAREASVRSAARAAEVLERVSKRVAPAEAQVQAAEKQHEEEEMRLKQQREKLQSAVKPISAIAFSKNGRRVATGNERGLLSTWEATTGVPVAAYDAHATSLAAITSSPQGQLVTLSQEGELALWDDDRPWQHVRSIGTYRDDTFDDRVTALDFSPDGRLLATGSGEPSRSGQLKLWNVEDGTLFHEIPDAHSDTIQCIRFSPDGSRIASSGADRFAKVFDVDTGEFVRAFEGHTHHVLGVTWRADGRALATSGADSVVKVWDARTGDQKRTITGFSKEVTGVSFLAASDNVVASSGDKSVQLKNTKNGRRVRNLSGAEDFMYCVATSADGKLIVAGGQDSVVRVWTEDGKSFAEFPPPN